MTYTFDNFLSQNPWRIDEKALNLTYFPRELINQIRPSLLTDDPLLITGPYASGKTILIQCLIQELIKNQHHDPNTIFYFNLDDPLIRDFFTVPEQALNFLRGFKPREATQIFLMVDEAQYLSAATRERFLTEPHLKLIWTSARATLSHNISITESTRRWQIFLLSTCHFREFLPPVLTRQNYYLPNLSSELKNVDEIIQISHGYTQILMPYLEEYVIYGGYPRLVRLMRPQHKQEALREIVNGHLKTIAASAIRIDEPDKFINLLTFLARRNGQCLNLQELNRQAGLDQRTTKRYLEIIIDNYFVSLVYPFKKDNDSGAPVQKSGRPINQGVPLVYFNDLGLRNTLLSAFNDFSLRPDQTVLLDNFLFQELRDCPEISTLTFYRTRSGLIIFAFVFKEHNYLAAVEYDYPKSKQGMRALVNLAQRIKPHQVIILTKDYILPGKSDIPNFIFLPAYWAWALPEILRKG